MILVLGVWTFLRAPFSAAQPQSHSRTSPCVINWRCCSDQPVDPGFVGGTGLSSSTIERDDVKGLRGVYHLLNRYVRSDDPSRKPISIAVFGPPGSGKSFAVKQLAKAVDGAGKRITEMEFNVAQFRDPEDLRQALVDVSSGSHHDKIPLAFFDEFDCALNDRRLGWLKYFLAPMQDGEFYGSRQRMDLGTAIFVFAGGIHPSFERFDPRTDGPDEELGYEISEEQERKIRDFTEQKGPDFISRLRGNINVLPINAEPGRVKHLIRRALQLRSILVREKYVHVPDAKARKEGDDVGTALVDDAVIYALLTVDRYLHGVRSMEAIVRMCRDMEGHLRVTSLPSRAQLHMHVDAEDFFIRVYRGRARSTW